MSAIGKGDLVQVVRTCCDRFPQGRIVFHVEGLVSLPLYEQAYCRYCHARMPREIQARAPMLGESWPSFPLSWLKKIPPLSELEQETRREEIPA